MWSRNVFKKVDLISFIVRLMTMLGRSQKNVDDAAVEMRRMGQYLIGINKMPEGKKESVVLIL